MFIEIGLLSNAALVGVLISFMVVTSPTVFNTLDKENSKKFLREVFPRLFNFCTAVSIFVALIFYFGNYKLGAGIAFLMAILFLINTVILTPLINKMRDLSLSGVPRASTLFKYLHLGSVLIYLLNLLAAFVIFGLFYLA